MSNPASDTLQIRDALSRYARAVDRAQWDLIRSVFHPDAFNDHGAYRGSVEGFIAWLRERFADQRATVHTVSNCLVEFEGPDLALAETYFCATRPSGPIDSTAPAEAAAYVQTWGRYIDRFERRGGQWRIARRCTVIDLRTRAHTVPLPASESPNLGRRDAQDPLVLAQARLRDSP